MSSGSTRLPFADYLAHLRSDSARFHAVLASVPSHAPVPSCPDWDADDLLFHLAVVQSFWATVVRDQASREAAEAVNPDRPRDRDALQQLGTRASAELERALAASDPATPAWSWWPADQTVGFTFRRQAHEALIHRVDAELTSGQRTSLEPALAADGVDEVLERMYGGPPAWGTFTPDPSRIVRFTSADTGHTWTVTVGRFVGTHPRTGTAYDEGCLAPAAMDAEVSAEVVGTAADLDCWLWRRPAVGEVQTSGDQTTLDALSDTMAGGV